MPGFTRRETLSLGVAAGVAIAFSGEASAAPTPAAAPTFTLVLVNDIYKAAAEHGRGGFAKLAAVVKAERARGVPMLFCHAGDTFSPSLISGFDQGAHIVKLTNMMAPDVFVPGNHEFDFGKAIYFQRQAEAKFPFFAANLRDAAGAPLPNTFDNKIFALGPVKVGVTGIVLAETPTMSSTEDLKFEDELETLQREAKILREAGADFVVCVAHTDRVIDHAIVKSRLADVLLTGHDHDLAIEYDEAVVMVESSEDAHYVTAIDITATIKGEGKDRKVSWRPSFRVHDTTSIEPDPEVQAVVDALETELAKELDVAVGTTAVELDSRSSSVRSRETAMGNLVADAERTLTGADVALANGGGIRANKVYAPGTSLSRRDILSELPFGNSVVLVELSGADLKAALENGLSMLEKGAGRFPQVSGLSLTVDASAPAGTRVTAVKVGEAPLDPAKTYKVAANDFMFAGGDGYTMLAKGKVLIGRTDGKLLATAVGDYVARLGTIKTGIEGRIVMK